MMEIVSCSMEKEREKKKKLEVRQVLDPPE